MNSHVLKHLVSELWFILSFAFVTMLVGVFAFSASEWQWLNAAVGAVIGVLVTTTTIYAKSLTSDSSKDIDAIIDQYHLSDEDHGPF